MSDDLVNRLAAIPDYMVIMPTFGMQRVEIGALAQEAAREIRDKDADIDTKTQAIADMAKVIHQIRMALDDEKTFRERDKAEIVTLRETVDKLTHSTDNGAMCLEINDLTAKLASAMSQIGGLRRMLDEAVDVIDKVSSFQLAETHAKTGKLSDVCKEWMKHKRVARKFLLEHRKP